MMFEFFFRVLMRAKLRAKTKIYVKADSNGAVALTSGFAEVGWFLVVKV